MTGDPAPARRSARRLPRPGRSGAALVFLLVAVLSCIPKALSSEWVLFQRDISSYWYPMVSTFVRGVADGGLPLWDPYEAYGLPLWADPGQQAAYPPTWLNLLLLPATAYKLLVLGHLFAGGAGVFALLRRFRLGVLPAMAGAVTFACSGPLASAGSLIHHLCGAAWMGWVLWAFEGVLERGSRRDVALLAVALGGQALAGSAETCAMSGLLVLLRWGTVAAASWGAAVRRVAPLAAAAGIGGLILAIQWLPTLALLGHTNRMQFPMDSKLVWSIHPATLVDALVPRLVSEVSMGEAVRDQLFDSREPLLMSLYLGIAAIPLVLLSLRSEREQRRWAWLSFAFFMMLALGRYLAPARWILALPPLSMFRYPSKYLWGASFAWAVLVGLGVEVWWRQWTRRDSRFAWVVGGSLLVSAAALAVGARWLATHPAPMARAFQIPEPWQAWMAILASWKIQTAAGWLAAAAILLALRAWRPAWAHLSALGVTLLVAGDLSTAARPVNPVAPAALMLHRPPLLEHLLPDAPHARLLSTGGGARRLNQDLTRGPAGWEPEWRWTLGIQEMISAPTGTRWNVRGSYDPDFTGLSAPSQAFMATLIVKIDGTPLGVRLLQLGNVGWVIGAFPQLPEVAQSQSVFTNPLRLRRVPDPLPPCYMVGAATHAPSDELTIRRIASSDFDPWGEVVLAGEGPNLDGSRLFRGAAVYRQRRANRLLIETEATAPGLLVVTEAFAPDWKATVDGVVVPIERANVLFRAVRVPPGRHLVEMSYFPRSVAWGMGASAVGLALVGFLLRPARRT